MDSLQDVRPHDISFTESQTVETITVNDMIAAHGVPRYCKIDIEGVDLAVIESLREPIEIVSFEHLPHQIDITEQALAALGQLADYRFNYFLRESHKFPSPSLLDAGELLRALRGPKSHGGSSDVFAFRRKD